MTHSRSVQTVYLWPEFEDDGGDGWAWRDFIDDLKENVLKPRYKAATDCDRWDGRETHVILESGVYEISVSEYCGLVAVDLAPVNDDGLTVVACRRMAEGFKKCLQKAFPSCALRSIGRFSNGEQIFEKVS